ncbi:MAG: hypothetical protein CMH97_10460 [Oceanospirillaceae bacterium]|nr:hypothetical protein A3746_06340 [Oleibacter sp. HI0075]MAE35630.1 hypothetical protein [Oceanospirillaceae bacterium]
MAEITIRSEQDAAALLERYFDNEIDQSTPLSIQFDGWPVLTMRLEGEGFDQSITPSVMKGFIELQSAIYKAVAIERYGPGGRLSQAERDELEFKIKVGKGSSIYNIDLQSLATTLINKAVPTMDPTTAAVTIVSLALVWAGRSAWNSYLDNRKNIRADELKSEVEREHLQTLQFMSEEETKRMALLQRVIEQVPTVDNASRLTDDARGDVLKMLRRTESASIGEIDLDPEIAMTLAKNARRKSVEVRLDGEYRIIKNDITDPDAFKVRLRNTKNKSEVEARVQDDSVNDALKNRIQQAEWLREPIKLRINAKSLDGEIKNAVVIGLQEE